MILLLLLAVSLALAACVFATADVGLVSENNIRHGDDKNGGYTTLWKKNVPVQEERCLRSKKTTKDSVAAASGTKEPKSTKAPMTPAPTAASVTLAPAAAPTSAAPFNKMPKSTKAPKQSKRVRIVISAGTST